MKKSRFTDEQIIGFLGQAEGGMPVKELCRLSGFSDATCRRTANLMGQRHKPEVPISGRSCWPAIDSRQTAKLLRSEFIRSGRHNLRFEQARYRHRMGLNI